MLQEEIESLFISVRDIILSRPGGEVAELAGLINNSPRRRRMHELELDDLQHLLQVKPCIHSRAGGSRACYSIHVSVGPCPYQCQASGAR